MSVMRTTTRRLVAAGLTIVFVLVSAASARAGVNDYPAQWANAPQDSMFDTWGEDNRECTSFVAWRLHSRNGFEMPFTANASDWGADAAARGYAVNGTPAVGAVAWSRSPQHVAWVESVNGSDVTIEDYNSDYKGNYGEHTVPASTYQYIHFKDLTGSAQPSNGGFQISFTANTGEIWSVGSAGTFDYKLGAEQGTSPSITALSNGGYQTAFVANTGEVWSVGSAGTFDYKLGTQPGTSPSIAALPNGGFQISFTANTGEIWSVGSAGTFDYKLGAEQGTSPSIH